MRWVSLSLLHWLNALPQEALSALEVGILWLMAVGLSSQQIADRLVAAVSTIRTHTKTRARPLLKASALAPEPTPDKSPECRRKEVSLYALVMWSWCAIWLPIAIPVAVVAVAVPVVIVPPVAVVPVS